MSSFIDAVEQRLGVTDFGASVDHPALWVVWPRVRQALTKVLSEAGPVAEVAIDLVPQGDQGRLVPEAYVVWLSEVEVGTLLFTAPPADERDARIAELSAALERLNTWQENYASECQRREDELRAQLASTQAALTEYIAAADNSMSPAGGDDVAAMLRFAAADKAARAAIAADQSAASDEGA